MRFYSTTMLVSVLLGSMSSASNLSNAVVEKISDEHQQEINDGSFKTRTAQPSSSTSGNSNKNTANSDGGANVSKQSPAINKQSASVTRTSNQKKKPAPVPVPSKPTNTTVK